MALVLLIDLPMSVFCRASRRMSSGLREVLKEQRTMLRRHCSATFDM